MGEPSMAKCWWITVAGEVLPVNAQWDAVANAPWFFGISQDDVLSTWGTPAQLAERWAPRPVPSDERRMLAMLDKCMATGCIWIDFSGRDKVVAFGSESAMVYDRLMRWATQQHIPPKTGVIIRETNTMRGWKTTVGALLKGFQFSRDPKKGGRCPRCGRMLSWDEVLHRSVCPECGEGLA